MPGLRHVRVVLPGAPPIEAGAAGSSDPGRAQNLAPMRNPLLERALAPVGQLLEIDLFEDLGGEVFGCGAKTAVIR